MVLINIEKPEKCKECECIQYYSKHISAVEEIWCGITHDDIENPGKFPNLCTGILIIEIDGVELKFGDYWEERQ